MRPGNPEALDAPYDPCRIEPPRYKFWEELGVFQPRATEGKDPFVIAIPPPNVTGSLTMGHLLGESIRDCIIRWQRMEGRETLYIPGMDHAGIATQNVVEKKLKAEGRSRHDLGREEFVRQVWAWKEEYGGLIFQQERRLGTSPDWSRERFTLDEGYSHAVQHVFKTLFDQGLIYRGRYIVNWCPRCQTALSDEEVDHKDSLGSMWYIRYPIKDSDKSIVVATTRPETMLGDTGVAVSPRDTRYKKLVGKMAVLPLMRREIPIVADNMVDPKFGTGAVKVTPAHDPNDFETGKRHGLPELVVMDEAGRMNENAGDFRGLDRFEARRRIVAALQDAGYLEKIEPHANSVGHCSRCQTVIEPYLSWQWFVKMAPLAAAAIEAAKKGRVKMFPAKWKKVYLHWLENIRDWCISRQIWWGHRIPVYTCAGCQHEWAARTAPPTCPKCGAAGDRIAQDPDVLDTWFSSWLWPFSTLGWPRANADLRTFYPTHDLVTAPEIIFFWVARMIMAGHKFMGAAPFRHVYIHGTVRDDQGRKMSKSLGNSIDPLGIIEQYSADALRFSLMMITATGQDVQVNPDKFEIGRNFGTKIWNAARFLQLHMEKAPELDWHALAAAEEPPVDPALLTDDDRHLLAKCDAAVQEMTAHLEQFRFQDGARLIYDFVWSDFCDWYVEYAKDDLYGENAARRAQVLRLMTHVFARALKLLHPYMPFLTEELWHAMGYGTAEESIMLAPWPRSLATAAALGMRESVTAFVESKHELIGAGRGLRADYGIAPTKPIRYVIHAVDAASAALLERDRRSLQALLRAGTLEIVAGGEARGMPGALARLGTIYLPLTGLIDVAESQADPGILGSEKGIKDIFKVLFANTATGVVYGAFQGVFVASGDNCQFPPLLH